MLRKLDKEAQGLFATFGERLINLISYWTKEVHAKLNGEMEPDECFTVVSSSTLAVGLSALASIGYSREELFAVCSSNIDDIFSR